MRDARSLKEMHERSRTDRVAPTGGALEQVFEQIRKEIERWRKVVAQAGIRIE